MTRLQDGLLWRFKEATDPNGGMPHQLGRVIRVNRKLHTVDVALRYGGTLTNVKVLKDVAGTNEGSGWLPDVDSGKTEDATPTFPGTGTNDSFCVVGYIEGRQREPYVVGFVPPPQFETSFEKMNVTKFHNGMYMVVDDDGLEFHRPDGTFMRLGGNTPAVVNAQNASKDVPFDGGTGTASGTSSVTMGSSSGAKTELKADGGIALTTPTNVQVTDSTGTFTLGSAGGVPVNVTKAAADAGAGTTSSRSDHKHDITTAVPSDVTKAAATEGTATSIARSDHKHDVTTATPANVTKAAAAEGTATTLSRSDHKHDATTATPSDVTKATAAEGAASSLARSDHKHDASTAVVGASAFADTAAEGTATSLARSDHRHSREANPTPTFATPTGVGTANAAGAAATIVRSDHVHSHTALGTLANAHAAADITNAVATNTVTTFTKQYVAAKVTVTFSATPTLDWNNGNVQVVTLTGNITTLTLSNPISGGRYVFVLTQDSTGGRTVAWPAAVKWTGGTAPTLSPLSKTDVVSMTYDGTNYYSTIAGNF